MSLVLITGGLGILTGFLSGLLGIGGGIIMAPLLLYVPPLFGITPLPMQTVSGLTIVQGLAACVSGGLTHGRHHFLSGRLVAWMGVTLFVSSFTGGVSARFTDNSHLLLVFAVMALIAAVLIVLPKKKSWNTRPWPCCISAARGPLRWPWQSVSLVAWWARAAPLSSSP